MDPRRAVGFTILIFLGVLTTNAWSGPIENNHLRNIYSWKSLEFAFPSREAREAAIIEGDFIPGKPLPIDVDTHHGGECSRSLSLRSYDVITITNKRNEENKSIRIGFDHPVIISMERGNVNADDDIPIKILPVFVCVTARHLLEYCLPLLFCH